MAVTHFNGDFIRVEEVRMGRSSLEVVPITAHRVVVVGNRSRGDLWFRVIELLRRLKRTLIAA